MSGYVNSYRDVPFRYEARAIGLDGKPGAVLWMESVDEKVSHVYTHQRFMAAEAEATKLAALRCETVLLGTYRTSEPPYVPVAFVPRWACSVSSPHAKPLGAADRLALVYGKAAQS